VVKLYLQSVHSEWRVTRVFSVCVCVLTSVPDLALCHTENARTTRVHFQDITLCMYTFHTSLCMTTNQ